MSYEWNCNAGQNHAPNTCLAGGSDIIITPVYGPCPETIDAGDSADGGGGFPIDTSNPTGGGDTPNDDTNNDDGTPHDYGENCVLDLNGNCLQDDTTPMPPKETIDVDDCNKLKQKITDVPLIKQRLKTLKDQGGAEKGLRIKINSSGEYEPSEILDNNNGTNHINIPVAPTTVAVVHTHPPSGNEYYAMFSSDDIIKMGEIVYKVQLPPEPLVELTEITHIIIADGITYALRFDDVASAQILLNIYTNPKKRIDFEEDLEKYYKSDNSGFPDYQLETTVAKQQRHLYNLFEDYNLSMSLYEASYDFNGYINGWQKINKDNLEKEPCN